MTARLRSRQIVAAGLLVACADCADAGWPDEPPDVRQSESGLTSDVGTLRWFVLEVADSPGGHPDYSDQQTFLHLANTNPVAVVARAIFRGAGGTGQRDIVLPASSRTSVPFSATELGLPRGFYAGELHSRTPGREIQVSATLFNGTSPGFGVTFWEASKAFNGATEPRTSWYFGEGGAFGIFPPIGGPVFDHWYIVHNPNAFPISVSTELYADMVDHGNKNQSHFDAGHAVAANSRLAFNPYFELPGGVALGSRAARISCSAPCFAQVIMNQLRGVPGRRPNTQSALGASLATSWHVIGIPTAQVWQHRIYILNPFNASNTITATYRNAAGAVLSSSSFAIPPLRRVGYDLNSLNRWDDLSFRPLAQAPQGLGGGDLSLQITSTHGIALTKIAYWSRDFSWSEGASTTGHSQGGSRVILPGGNTGNGANAFQNFTQVMHVGEPGTSGTNVWATVLTPGGPCVTRRHVGFLNPKGILQVVNGACPGYVGDFATVFESDGPPIIAESTNLLAPDSVSGIPWRSGDAVEGLVYAGGTAPVQP
jgi:hypothetical protein